MLYVFHVDTGTMMTFNMKLAMESVASLQRAIAKEYHILEDKQVLLISGGESLDPAATVGKYHAGTDTNPIFLFSKSTIEAQHPPSPSVHYGSDVDIQSQVEGSLLMPPAYGTVVSRAQLALQIHEVDHEELKACEQLVHDQHLQQQGWAAVVANLEDITSALRYRSEIFTQSYNEYLSPREDYLKTLASVEHSLQLLAKIPVLPCLIQQSTDLYDKSSSSSSGSSTSYKSLFDWISSQDPSHSLHDMVVKCIKATEQLDERVLNTLTKEVQDTFVQVDNPSMKEVKGIEDRLYGLDQILSAGRRVVQEQSDMAQGFVQNQNRVSTLKDKSILPDLCSSHKKQLLVMVNNHKKIQETKKKCKMAKEELAINLHARLRWVMLVEKRICDVDGKLMIYHENLKRLRKRLEVLKQIHDAPSIYAYLVVEVVRRRKFSSTFSEWASSIAEESTQIHSEEFKRREAFINQVGRHFLQTLFTGLESFSSSFAMEPPAAVDQTLPDITEDDIIMLKTSVPELADLLVVPADSNKIIKSHWGVLTCTTNKSQTPKPSSLQTSEIEIIQSYDERFYTADHTELSLGDQVASSELTSNLLTKSDIGITSPTEKTEFIMPKSLSEELTKEMQEASHKKLLEASSVGTSTKHIQGLSKTGSASVTGEVSGTFTSSGDQIKSIESDSSHDKSTESSNSGKKKSALPGNSPDMDMSQEFTTADFYIEDSMPSSIGGSPPSVKNVDKSLKQPETNAEAKELSDYKTKLELTETKLQTLKDFVSICFPDLKQKIKDFESSINCDRTKFSQDFENTKQKVVEMLKVFDLHQQNVNKSNVEMLEQGHKEEKFKLLEDIESLKNKNVNMEHLLDNTRDEHKQEKEMLEDKICDLEKHKQEKEMLEDKICDLEKHKQEKEMLEDKICDLEKHKQEKEMLEDKICDLEKHKQEKEMLEDKICDLEKHKQEKEMLEDKICDLEKECCEVSQRLEITMSQKSELEGQLQKLTAKVESCNSEIKDKTKEMEEKFEEMETKYKQELIEIAQQHSLEMEVELDKVRSDLLVQMEQLEAEVKSHEDKSQLLERELSCAEKEKINMEETLTSKYQTEKESIEKILTDEFNEKLIMEKEKHSVKLKEIIDELQNTHDKEISTLRDNLLKSKEVEIINIQEKLKAEYDVLLVELKEKHESEKVSVLHQQKEELLDRHSDDLMKLNEEFNKCKQDFEDQLKVYTDKVHNDDATQTDHDNTVCCSIQTDVPSIISVELQTEYNILTGLTETQSQTEIVVINTNTQTEINKFQPGETQTDKQDLIQGETQTDLREVIQGETQTDLRAVIQCETQTDLREVDQGETQTDLREVIQVEMQTDSWVGVLSVTPTEVEERCVQTDVSDQVPEDIQSYTQKLTDLQEQHQREINSLVLKFERDKEESCSLLKTSLIAERQMSFNEAVNKVCNEKDSIITELRDKEAALADRLKVAQETISKLVEDKSKAEDVKTRALAHLGDKEREFNAFKRSLEDESAMLKQQLTQYQEQIQCMSVSSAPSVMEISTLDEKDSKTKLSLLEEEVKLKQEEISRMEQKLSEITMTASTRSVVQDKVSITSCNTGDLALFCLDERHDQYVVFTIGGTLHFLHSDCIEPLGLQPNPNESRKSWVLAEITEKEYCQAKKPQNRFKVPLGTKFYRVKAKPWTRDTLKKGDSASGSS